MTTAYQGDGNCSTGHPDGYRLINIGKQSGNGNKHLHLCFKKHAPAKSTSLIFISASVPYGSGSKIAGLIQIFYI